MAQAAESNTIIIQTNFRLLYFGIQSSMISITGIAYRQSCMLKLIRMRCIIKNS